MESFVTGAYTLLALAAIVAAPVWIFRWRLPRARTGNSPRWLILLQAAGILLAALCVPAGLLLLLIGVEELAGTALVPERIALLTLGLTALHLAGGIVTLIVLAMRLERKPPA